MRRDANTDMRQNRASDKIMTGVHVLGTLLHGTLHSRCIVIKLLYATGRHRMEDLLGHMG